MAVGLRSKQVLAVVGQLVICLLVVVAPETVLAQYQPGLQHVYPFYYPDDALVNNSSTGFLNYPDTPSPVAPPGSSVVWNNATFSTNEQAYVTTFGGNRVQVNQVIADNVGEMFADLNGFLTLGGLDLVSGGGFRSRESQIKLRIDHCGGDTYYNKFEKPSSSCSPPTARPGTSRHEKGLAIDFNYLEPDSPFKLYAFKNSPAFFWLKTNAASYGLYNLPSEPWHWSTDGR